MAKKMKKAASYKSMPEMKPMKNMPKMPMKMPSKMPMMKISYRSKKS